MHGLSLKENFTPFIDKLKVDSQNWRSVNLSTFRHPSPPWLTWRLPLSYLLYPAKAVVINTLRVWSQFRNHYNLSAFSHLASICDSHLSSPNSLQSKRLYFKYLYQYSIYQRNPSQKWEEELGVVIPEVSWTEALWSQAGCNSVQVLHHTHLFKSRLARFYHEVYENCSRCQVASATLTHMFWSCNSLSEYFGDYP